MREVFEKISKSKNFQKFKDARSAPKVRNTFKDQSSERIASKSLRKKGFSWF
jgi:hypothetical protein